MFVFNSHSRVDGHVVSRQWQSLPCCQTLATLLGTLPLQMQVFPSVASIENALVAQVGKHLKPAGFPRSSSESITVTFATQLRPYLLQWAKGLPLFLQLKILRPALRQVHAAGFIFLQVCAILQMAWRALSLMVKAAVG